MFESMWWKVGWRVVVVLVIIGILGWFTGAAFAKPVVAPFLGWERKAYYNFQRGHAEIDDPATVFGDFELLVCNPTITDDQFWQFDGQLPRWSFFERVYLALDNTLDWDARNLCDRGGNQYWCLKAAALPPSKLYTWGNWTNNRGELIPAYRLDTEAAHLMAHFHKYYTLSYLPNGPKKWNGVYQDMSLTDWWPAHLYRKAKDQAGWDSLRVAQEIAPTAVGRRVALQLLHPHGYTGSNTRLPNHDPNIDYVCLEGTGHRFNFYTLLAEAIRMMDFHDESYPERQFGVVLWRSTNSDTTMIRAAQETLPELIVVGYGPWYDDPLKE